MRGEFYNRASGLQRTMGRRISQRFLQIVKCTDEKCCDPFQKNWFNVFPGRFLPTPVQFRHSTGGPTDPFGTQAKSTEHFADLWKCMAINKLVPQNDYEVLPYDTYRLSVKSGVKKRVCDFCGIYYPRMAVVKRHKTGGDTADAGEERCPIVKFFDFLNNPTFIEDN